MPDKKQASAKKAPSKKKTAPASSRLNSGKRPVRREVWSFICFFLAVFSFIGFFDVEGIFIDFFKNFLRGLLGFGHYSMTVMLLAASAILLFHKGRPVRLRVWSCISLSAVYSSILHLFMSDIPYAFAFDSVPALYRNGGALKSGGLIGGFVAEVLKVVFSKVGAAVLLIGSALLLLFLAFNISIVAIIEYLFYREKPQYEPQESPQPAKPAAPKPAALPLHAERQRVRNTRLIDIPLDDDDELAENHGLFSSRKNSRGLFSKRPPHIKTPDEVLKEAAVTKAAAPTQAAPDTYDTEAVIADTVEKALDRSQAAVLAAQAANTVAPAAMEAADSPSAQAAYQKPNTAEDEEIKQQVSREIEKNAEAPVTGIYNYPPFSLLTEAQELNTRDVSSELKVNANRLCDTIKSFGIEARLINVTRGPSITRYELEMDRGIKLTKLTGIADDIALSLGVTGVRIAPIPDKVAVVGIEVPNKAVSIVRLREVLEAREFMSSRSNVAFAVGKDIGGECIVGDISQLPHLLIAGTTGSGKSVCMNSLIISLLYKSTPEEVRLIMIDPKMIELNIYNGIPHLLIPVVTDPRKASGALQWAVTEMMRRYKIFSDNNTRDINQYNELAASNDELQKLPRIVIVIDELADLMLVAAKEVEETVCRIAQMARAAGMHLVIATQRPSADVITGIMKANIPSRIAFAVASQLESRIILDTTGAEKLVGKGDMLYYPLGAGKPMRIQGCFISSDEVERVVDFVKKSGKPDYSDEVLEHIERSVTESESRGAPQDDEDGSDLDDLFVSAVEIMLESGQASVSMLQRRLKLGYARAARLVDQIESRGIVGPFEGAKPRQLLITREQWEEMKLNNPEYQ